jgi:opacity protein-like surface antigen
MGLVPKRLLRLTLFLILGLSLVAGESFSQTYGTQRYGRKKFEITPYGGYFFSGNVTGSVGSLNIKDSYNYGLILDIAVQREVMLELFWSQSENDVEFVNRLGIIEDKFKVSTNYFQIGANYAFGRKNVRPFGVFTLGAVYFSPAAGTSPNVTYSDEWRFAMSMGGGVKIYLTESIGIRLQGRLMFPLYFSGGGFYLGTGGAGFGVGAGIPVLQGDLSAGLIIGLGD